MKDRGYTAIAVEGSDHVATLTLNRPEKKNALSQDAVNELLWALDDAKEDANVRVIVITGAGGNFSAGADLKGMTSGGDRLAKKGEFDDLLLRFPALGKPTIAKIEGYALAGSTGIIASCDFAIAAKSAKLGIPEIKRGLFPMMIMAVLQQVIPRRKLLQLMLLGERITADQAVECDLLTEAVPDDALHARVTELATQLASQSPTAMRMGLAAYHHQRALPLNEALPYLREQLYALINTEDAREGLAAFFEKRDPKWTGR